MWYIWIKDLNTWMESSTGYSDEQEALAVAKEVKRIFWGCQVFIQRGNSTPKEVTL